MATPFRGTAVQFGSLAGARSISQHGQIAAATTRLREAASCQDTNEMQAALQALEACRPGDIGIPKDAEAASAAIRQRLEGDTELRRHAMLKRSTEVRTKVRRLWDLMVAESVDARRKKDMVEPESEPEPSPGEVSREGYRQIHARVAKALVAAGAFSSEECGAMADADWTEDIARYSGTSHILIWLQLIRERFREGAAESVARQGFEALFSRYDADGSGELDSVTAAAGI